MSSKDPALLFYTADFLTGTLELTDQEVGQYIRLLCFCHQKGGYLSEKEVKCLCNTEISDDVLSKFKKTDDGFYYNERLLEEIDKRNIRCQKQRDRVNKRWNSTGNTSAVIQDNGNTSAVIQDSNTSTVSLKTSSNSDSDISTNNIMELSKKNNISSTVNNKSNIHSKLSTNDTVVIQENGNTSAVLPVDNDNDNGVFNAVFNKTDKTNTNALIKNSYSVPQPPPPDEKIPISPNPDPEAENNAMIESIISDLKVQLNFKGDETLLESHFQIFWDSYPRKEGMEICRDEFKKIAMSRKVAPMKLMSAVKDYHSYCIATYPNDFPHSKYIKLPINWLRDKNWTINWQEKALEASRKKPKMATNLFGGD